MKPVLPTLLLTATLAPPASAESIDQVRAFLESAEAQLSEVWQSEARASWVRST